MRRVVYLTIMTRRKLDVGQVQLQGIQGALEGDYIVSVLLLLKEYIRDLVLLQDIYEHSLHKKMVTDLRPNVSKTQ